MTATYNPASATASTYKATTLDPLDPNSRVTTATWEPDSKSLVQDRMTGLLSQDSDYMKQAKTAGVQFANSRGLLNSSMAGKASQAAAIQAALPIASQDASTFASAGQFNAGAENDTRRFNAGSYNQIGLANTGFQNDASKFNAGNTTNVSIANAEMKNDAGKFNAGETNTSARLASELASRESIASQNVAAQTAIADANRASSETVAAAAREATLLAQAGSLLAGSLNSHNEFARMIEASDLDPETKALMIANDEMATLNVMSLTGSVFAITGLDEIWGDFGSGGGSATPDESSPNATATLYRTLLGRDPDAEGLAYWGDTIDPDEMASFLASAGHEAAN